MGTKNYYEILGVPQDASREAIREAFLKKAQQLHPDRHAESSPGVIKVVTVEMAEVNEAHRQLEDPLRRQDYDRLLERRSREAIQQTTAPTRITYYNTAPSSDTNFAALGILAYLFVVIPLVVAITSSNLLVRLLWAAALLGVIVLAGAIWYVMRD